MHISPLSVRALRAKGHEISRITEFLPPTAADLEILDLARRQGAVLITADLDFSALIATRGETGPSVISLRLALPSPGRIAAVLEQTLPWLQAELERGAIVAIDESSIRIRRLPIR